MWNVMNAVKIFNKLLYNVCSNKKNKQIYLTKYHILFVVINTINLFHRALCNAGCDKYNEHI